MARTAIVVAMVVGIALATGARASAQQSPFKPPSNFHVLPKDTKLAEIIPMMKGFTRRSACAASSATATRDPIPNALENFDFPGDDVPAKATARKMITMLQTINSDLLKDVGRRRRPDSRR